jgi:hypothetical protein
MLGLLVCVDIRCLDLDLIGPFFRVVEVDKEEYPVVLDHQFVQFDQILMFLLQISKDGCWCVL